MENISQHNENFYVPAISVVMAVHNGIEHLDESIKSILGQSFVDFEFIIIDDASTDGSSNLLEKYSLKDSRIIVVTNESNKKLATSLNIGMHQARAALIARMDADDWAHPDRLCKQYELMQAHPDVTLCGTCFEEYETGRKIRWGASDAEIRAYTLFDPHLAHPTVMFRKEAIMRIAGGYDSTLSRAQDYDLWTRLSVDSEVKFANLPNVLLRYRIYPGKDRSCQKEEALAVANNVRGIHLRRLGFTPTEQEVAWHAALAGYRNARCAEELRACGAWGRALLAANTAAGIYATDALKKAVNSHWLQLCHASSRDVSSSAFIYTQYALVWNAGTFRSFMVLVVKSALQRLLPKGTLRQVWCKRFVALLRGKHICA